LFGTTSLSFDVSRFRVPRQLVDDPTTALLGKGGGMSVLIDFSIFPVDKGGSVSSYVTRAVKIIRESGLPYKVGPMGTTIEGEWEEAIGLVGRCLGELRKDCDRVYMTLKVDYRKGPGGRIESKVKSLGQSL
jgi:uncharacterized protein (TIGR00106 family)